MPAVDPVILQLRAELAQYRNQIQSTTILVDKSLRDQEKAVQRLEFQFKQSGDKISAVVGRLKGAVSGIALIAAARQFLSFADAAKQIDAQLRLATQSFGTFGRAQADVERIAADTRSGLSETASLYGNMVRATQALGGTQDQAARATETFTKALKIGGASSAEAASATLQFGQALASGALRGDEFNSIAEASPRILRLVAEAMGVPQGALRKLAEEGKLTSDVLQRALTDKKFTAGIDAEFATLPVTFGDAMTKVTNAATITFGAFDRGGEFSTALANFISDGTEGMTGLASTAEETGINIRAAFAGLTDVFQPLVEGAFSAFGQVEGRAESLRNFIGGLLGGFDKVNNAFIGLDRFGARFDNGLKRGLNTAIDRAGGGQKFTMRNVPAWSDVRGNFERSFDRSQRGGQTRARIRKATADLERKGYVVPAPDAAGNIDISQIKLRPRAVAQPKPPEDAKKRKGPKGPSAETLANRAEAQRQRELRNDEAYEREKADLNQDLIRAKQSVATAAETFAQYELQEIEAQRVRQNASYQADVAQKKLTQARADELVALNDKVAAERANAVNLREEERRRTERVAIASADLENQRDLVSAQSDLARTSEQRRDSALRLLDLQYQEEKLRLEAILASRQATEAEKEIARRRLASLDGIYGARKAGIEQDNAGPLQGYRNRLKKSPEELAEDAERAVVAQLDYVQDGIRNALMDKLGVKDPLIAGILDMFIEQVIMRPLADAFSKSGSGGGFGSIFSAIGSLFGRASGGYVGPGQTVRVNENRPGVELLRMGSQGGTVIPLGQQAVQRQSRGGITVQFNPSIDARGADSAAVARIEASLARALAELPGTIVATVKNAQDRFAL